MHRIRGNLTYANVMATIAVFLVLAGGTAFAASVVLPKNSVGSKQIKKGAVGPAKLSTAAKATLTGPAGAKGATGATGTKGATGTTGSQGKDGKEGSPGKEGPRGPSAGLSTTGENAIPWTGSDQTIATLPLSAGNWILTAKTTAVNSNGTQKEFRCELRVNGILLDRNNAGAVGVPLGANGGLNRQTTMLTNGIAVGGASTAELVCTSNATEGFWVFPTMTAIQVATLNGAP
jgi:Collagen triple helix repeat (20 copies)